MPIASLKPYPRNARTHSRKQIKQIANSIQRFGFTNPALISDDNEIVAGHGRVEATKLLGYAETRQTSGDPNPSPKDAPQPLHPSAKAVELFQSALEIDAAGAKQVGARG